MTQLRNDNRRTKSGDIVTNLVLAIFRLNGQFLAAAERIAQPAGLTAAWWQVLGAVLSEPAPVSTIARAMGLSRQSVQRIADILVRQNLAEYLPNPAHRRAKLLAPTTVGLAAIEKLQPAQHNWANAIAQSFTREELHHTETVIKKLISTTAPAG